MPPPVYVQNLFALLRLLGVSQQAVAASLGVSKGLVSLWAQGKVPLPHHRLPPFFTLFAHTIETALPLSERHSVRLRDLSDYGPTPSPQRQFEHTVDEYLHRWLQEQLDRWGVLEHQYRTAVK